MAFLDNIRDIFGVDVDNLTCGLVTTIYSDRGVHIEGSVKVVYFSDEEIRLKGKKTQITIYGKNLSLFEISNYDVYVLGVVTQVSRSEL
ncbi:MAG: YabP/YqfC family sporulation protein [Clostridia bacterium]|nr:YabP/YqfC family sporulation protein [Clostridia bacterium]